MPETVTRDAIDAEQEAAGPCRKTRRGRRKRRHGNCIFGALRSNAGSDRPRRRTADRPAKLNRTPARAADAAPGAVDSSQHPTEKDFQRRNRRRSGARRFAPSPAYRIAQHAVFDGAAGTRYSVPVRGRTLPGRLPGIARSASPKEVAAMRTIIRSHTLPSTTGALPETCRCAT